MAESGSGFGFGHAKENHPVVQSTSLGWLAGDYALGAGIRAIYHMLLRRTRRDFSSRFTRLESEARVMGRCGVEWSGVERWCASLILLQGWLWV